MATKIKAASKNGKSSNNGKAAKPKTPKTVEGITVGGFVGKDGKHVSMIYISLRPMDRYPIQWGRGAAAKFLEVYDADPNGCIEMIRQHANGQFDQ